MKSSYTRIGEKKVFFKTKIEGEGGERDKLKTCRLCRSTRVPTTASRRVKCIVNRKCRLLSPCATGQRCRQRTVTDDYSKNKAAICLAVSTADSRRRQIFSSFPPTPSMPPPWHKPCNLPPPLTPVS